MPRAAKPEVPAPPDPWLSAKDAAHHVGYSVDYLRHMRRDGGGPEFVKTSAGTIRYRLSALNRWMEGIATRGSSAPIIAAMAVISCCQQLFS